MEIRRKAYRFILSILILMISLPTLSQEPIYVFDSQEHVVDHIALNSLFMTGEYHIDRLKNGEGTEHSALYLIRTPQRTFFVKFTVKNEKNLSNFTGNIRVKTALDKAKFNDTRIIVPIHHNIYRVNNESFLVSVQPFVGGQSLARILIGWSFAEKNHDTHKRIAELFFNYGKILGKFHRATLKEDYRLGGEQSYYVLRSVHLKGRSLDNTVVDNKTMSVSLIDFETPKAGTEGLLYEEMINAFLSIHHAFAMIKKGYFDDYDTLCVTHKEIDVMSSVTRCRKKILRDKDIPRPIPAFISGYLSEFDRTAVYYPYLKNSVSHALKNAYWQSQ